MATTWLSCLLALFQDVDASVLHALNALAGNAVFDQTVDFISSNNFVRGTLPVGLYWYFWFRPSSDRGLDRTLLLKGIAATIVAILAARGLAHLLPSRIRPFADPSSGFVPFLEPNGRSFEDWSSFPSDTAAYEFALCWSLFYISRPWSVAVLIYTAVFSCVTRVYTGVHYPSDIVVGGAIGILTSCCVQRLPVPRAVPTALGNAERSHPLFYVLAFYVTAELGQVFDNVRDGRRFLLSVSRLTGNYLPLAVTGLILAAVVAVLWVVLTQRLRLTLTAAKRTLRAGEVRSVSQNVRLKSTTHPEAV